MLDSLRQVETPEGIDLQLRLAGPVVRVLAWGLDCAIRLGFYLVLSSVLGVLGKLGVGLTLIAVFVLEWFYPVLFEVYRQGATPGKRAFGLVVLHDDGTPICLTASIVRNLLRFVDFLPLGYGFGLVCMLMNREFRRLGDLAAGTLVVYRESPVKRASRPQETAAPAPYPLTKDEQRTVLEFAERAPHLAPERAEELAGLAVPLVRGARDRVARLYAIANYLAGAA